MYMLRFLLFIVACGFLLTGRGNDTEQKVIVMYKVLTFSQVQKIYHSPEQAGNTEAAKKDSELYAFGYLQLQPSYKTPRAMVELTFYNPEKRAYRKSTNLGWIGNLDKRFFLIYLGSQNQFSSVDYTTRILMEK